MRRVPPATSSARASMKADAQARTALMCVVNSKSECCTISSSSQAPSTFEEGGGAEEEEASGRDEAGGV